MFGFKFGDDFVGDFVVKVCLICVGMGGMVVFGYCGFL